MPPHRQHRTSSGSTKSSTVTTPSMAGLGAIKKCKKHGIPRIKCEDCSKLYCEHDRHKGKCKDCGGPAICKHKKFKRACKDCSGTDLCVHQKLKHDCIDCKGKGVCDHGKLKRRCKECKGSSCCEHGRHKYRCKECAKKGVECKGICMHGKEYFACEVCSGKLKCPHGYAITKAMKFSCTTCNRTATAPQWRNA